MFHEAPAFAVAPTAPVGGDNLVPDVHEDDDLPPFDARLAIVCNFGVMLAWLRERPGDKNMTKWELRDMHARTWMTNGLRGLPSREEPFLLDRSDNDTGVTRLLVRVPEP